MAETKSSTPRKSSMSVDTALVRELAELLDQSGLSEIEVIDGERTIRVARNGGVATVAPAPVAMTAPAPVAAPAAEATAETAPVADTSNAVKSPMVGTVYLAPEPGAPNFKSVGDSVKAGDTIVIVEAMKVMNPITADKDGKLTQVLVGNADPVEFGQPLFVIA